MLPSVGAWLAKILSNPSMSQDAMATLSDPAAIASAAADAPAKAAAAAAEAANEAAAGLVRGMSTMGSFFGGGPPPAETTSRGTAL